MTVVRRIALPALLVLLGFGAAPAQATLLVRSDGNGLFVQDKNGLNDTLLIRGGSNGYRLTNMNSGDIFRFDRQTGCQPIQGDDRSVFCQRVTSKIRVEGEAGDDYIDLGGVSLASNVLVHGDSGRDHVVGHLGKDDLRGGSGNDIVDGGVGGDDTIHGDTGDDDLDGGQAGADTLRGGEGFDTIQGGNGPDVINGDSGKDKIFGQTGDDVITSKEPSGTNAREDRVDCGAGFDSLVADLPDVILPVSLLVDPSCEDVDQSPVGETPNVDILGKTLWVSRSGKVRVRMRCPRGVKKLGCKGRLQLRIDRRAGSSRSRRVRYKIKAGRHKTVTLRLTRRGVRTLRKRQGRGKRTRGIVVSVEKGRKGRKTTVRNPKLKLLS